ncbi:MAG TPA: inositol monophosphatase family protein, partial [Thermoanaerobaculia bacterium]|nr:inositol monophosphatase family protein [Thermoanaerobaculia bacterium]
ERLRVSTIRDIGQSFVGYDSITDFTPLRLEPRFLDLLRACDRSRGFGDFWAHMLVAEGAIDIAVEPKVALWDMAAVQIIVEEAGGRFTTLGGEARADGGSGLSTNGLLHDAALESFR